MHTRDSTACITLYSQHHTLIQVAQPEVTDEKKADRQHGDDWSGINNEKEGMMRGCWAVLCAMCSTCAAIAAAGKGIQQVALL
jgi:hypothetical protein